MILSLGTLRETIIEAKRVAHVTPEIIQCDCPECEGTGDWSRFMPEPCQVACNTCKGTGRIYA